uniref:Uncharacterized protein n=1 Tax=Arundo donax TaxID=35708 RepID=A0A0A9HCG4_ARUDO
MHNGKKDSMQVAIVSDLVTKTDTRNRNGARGKTTTTFTDK